MTLNPDVVQNWWAKNNIFANNCMVHPLWVNLDNLCKINIWIQHQTQHSTFNITLINFEKNVISLLKFTEVQHRTPGRVKHGITKCFIWLVLSQKVEVGKIPTKKGKRSYFTTIWSFQSNFHFLVGILPSLTFEPADILYSILR